MNMDGNFTFLEARFPVLAKLGIAAETYLYSDADACLYKLGKLGESLVLEMMKLDGIAPPQEDLPVNRIRVLRRSGMLPRDIDDILYTLRTARNKAVHTNDEALSDAKVLLEMAYHLSVWFMQTYGDWDYQPTGFKLPPDRSKEPDYKAIAAGLELELARLQSEHPESAAKKILARERAKRASAVAGMMQLSEAETRYHIDEQLRKVGWEADTLRLRHSKGTLPQKGRNLAIAEWPTDSKVGDRGRADYALFVGLRLVGIIEAKAAHKDIHSVIDYQCKAYAEYVKPEHDAYLVGSWGRYQVPFVFATNGRPYLQQLKTKSGIWFLDLREPSNAPKALQGWMSPEGLTGLLDRNLEAANKKLEQTPYDLLTDRNGLHLRNYQVRAVQAAEEAVRAGKPSALLAMATGTGKTRTAIGLIYRLLKSERFRRILFLVDRNTLGTQAQDKFHEAKIEDLKTLFQIYNIAELDAASIDPETRVQVATVQSMVRRVLYNEGPSMPAVTDYDCIIVDEAHRGYLLDREMGEDEQLYRDQKDYVSKYRAVIEYFDAFKIALTATPAVHTTQIFGPPVFTYSYREAVLDGWLVDHDAPHVIETKLSREGIHYKAGETVVLYDPITGELMNGAELEDDLDFEVEQFNKRVITEPWNRMVLKEIAKDFDPESFGKMLIYAANDDHADLVVSILNELYGHTGVDNDAVRKITGSVGDKKAVEEAVKRFKTERYPSIAVTVDLLTTGVDVPEITTLVFLRRVKSRILFEQMLGRATRLCPEIQKTHFKIYDAVGVYASIDPVNSMKPVSVDPKTTFASLLDGLEILQEPDKRRYQTELILAKLQRKKRGLRKKAQEHFKDLSGGLTPDGLIQKIRESSPEEAQVCLSGLRDLFRFLDAERTSSSGAVVVSDREDELVSHHRGYGAGQCPEDYLDAFSTFVKRNLNQIAALNIVCTRPRELTREQLKSLRLTLDREGFTEPQLNTAIGELTSEQIAADLISIIRRYAIGSALLSHGERIRRAVDRLLKTHKFTKQEENWVHRMETYLLNESVLNERTFNEGAFQDAGGFKRIDKIFNNQLKDIVRELNEYLYDDGGHIA